MISSAEIPVVGENGTKRLRRLRNAAVPLEVLGIGYFLLLVLVGVALVWQPAKMTQVRQSATKLQAVLQDLKLRNEDLKKTVANMESLAYFETEARDRLGMVEPEQVKICEIPEHLALAAYDTNASLADKDKPNGIRLLIARIAGIFNTNQATAKGE